MLRRVSPRSTFRAEAVSRASRTAFEPLEFRRLLSASSLDPTFGTEGVVTTDFGGLEGAVSAAVQSDGKIVAVGTDFDAEQGVMARYHDDGTLDTSFGSGGKVLLGTYFFDDAVGVAVGANGQIYVAGNTAATGNGDFVVARFNGSGSIDPSYGMNGVTVANSGFWPTQPTDNNDTAVGLAVRGDGTAVVAGTTDNGSSTDFSVLQLDPTGTPDSSFAGDGWAIVDFGSSSSDDAFAMALQSDGRVVVVGRSSQNFALVRFDTAGELDQTFGTLGLVKENFGGTISHLTSVALGGGSIYVAGRYSDVNGTSAALARYSSSGALDNAFGGSTNGVVRLADTFEARGVGVDSTGKVLVAANTASLQVALWRFNANGTADAGFGDGGSVMTPLMLAGGLTIQPDDKVLVLGTDGEDFTLVRYGEEDDGGDDVFTVEINPENGNLEITGTTGSDSVTVTRNTSGVFVESGGVVYGPFTPGGWIIMNLGDGDDQVNVSSSLTVPMYINGGAGNDTIKGGGGNDILIGGAGDDRIMGAGGRDIIIGGTGADRILGHQDDDILIASNTSYDDATPANIAALQAIMAEWTSGNSFTQRVNNIRNGGGANGSFRFNSSTVFDDGSRDSLTGNAGTDWFIFNQDGPVADVVTDVHPNEFGEELP